MSTSVISRVLAQRALFSARVASVQQRQVAAHLSPFHRMLSTSPKPPKSPAHAAFAPKEEAPAASTKAAPAYDMNAEPESVTVDSSIRTKNAALAAALACFCFAVAAYSMNAVGQSGVNEDGEDPLAVLKQEAAGAQEKRAQQEESEKQQQEMLQQFEAGQFDPDKQELDELEAADDGGKKKKPWWKFWARG